VPPRRIVVIGGSAGSLESLKQIVSELPPDLPAAVFVAVHVAATARSTLAPLLQRRGRIKIEWAIDEAPIEPEHIYVSRPDRHLLVGRSRMHLGLGPRENGHRPAIDALFRSAARNHGPRVIGVVLSGLLDDGTLGLAVIREEGGIGVVEDPGTAAFSAMPQHAIEFAKPEYVVPAVEVGALLARLCEEQLPSLEVDADLDEQEELMVDEEPGGLAAGDVPGIPTGLTCPECSGALWEDPPGGFFFRCRIGHRLAAESLMEAQTNTVESALWAALRALEEKATTAARIGERLAQSGDVISERRFKERAESARRQALILRQALAEPRD
jgi:two-component system chemotaxis response regulator CheB